MTTRSTVVLAALAAASIASAAHAQMQPFHGFDPFVQPNGAMPNAGNSHAAWVAAASPLSPAGIACYDFNPMAVGTPCPPGLFNATGTPLIAFPGGLANFNPVIPATGGSILTGGTESVANGWDTTTPPWFDNQHRLSLVVPYQLSSVNYAYDLTFNPPIQGFGMYVTGEGNTVQAGQMFLTFTDSNASWMIPMNATIGGQFVGFIDPGQAISRVTLMLTPDVTNTYIQPFISLDDICVVWNYGPGCPADFDHSGFVDLEDYDAFVHAFEKGADIADFDHSGFVDLEDFGAFVHDFEEGC